MPHNDGLEGSMAVESVVKLLIGIITTILGGIAFAIWSLKEQVHEGRQEIALLKVDAASLRSEAGALKSEAQALSSETKLQAAVNNKLAGALEDIKRELAKKTPRPQINNTEKNIIKG